MLTSTQIERFWSYVDVREPEECWSWTAGRVAAGYGEIGFMKDGKIRMYRAHRLAYQLNIGPISKGLFVCHSCDNPACVNPAHLWLGSAKQNTQDAITKNRLARGERHGSRTHPEALARGERVGGAKLTTRDISEIREARNRGISVRVLATRFGVSIGAISMIANRQRWAHVF